MAIFIGTAGDDQIAGGPDNDHIFGLAGNDELRGAEGDDTLEGGDGNDFLAGHPGDDLILGGPGDDFIRGGDGNDLILGGPGDDGFENGGPGNDTIRGGDGNDHLRGESGLDVLDGGPGFDRVSLFHIDALNGVWADLRTQTVYDDGYGNTETLSSIEALGGGTMFADRFYGDDNVNLLWAGGGDRSYGFGGDDEFVIDDGPALADGGPGIDSILEFSGSRVVDLDGDGRGDDFEVATLGVVADLGQGKVIADGFGGSGRIRNFENMRGSILGDTLTGANGDNVLAGWDGDDMLAGLKGNDTLDGEAGNDTLAGGHGADVFRFGETAGQDRVSDFRDGTDRIELHAVPGVAAFGDLTLAATAGGTLVSWGGAGDSVFLAGFAPSGLSAVDFIFS